MPEITLQQAFELAVQHQQVGRLQEAESLYRQILAVEPRHAGALHYLGFLAHMVGQNDVAIGLIRQSIALEPGSPYYYSNLGEAYRAAGQLDEAIAAYRHAIAIKPDLSGAHNNLGIALNGLGLLDQAIDAYRQSIALNPDEADVHSNLGSALYIKGCLDEAEAECRDAIMLQPDYAPAHNNLGNALKDNGRADEAVAAFRQAITFKPELSEAHSNLILALHYHSGRDAEAIAEEHRCWNRRHAEPLRKFIQPHANDRDQKRRLRVGYVSADFRDHVVGQNMMPLFDHHDHEGFEVFCYAAITRSDTFTDRFRASADHWRNTVGVGDEVLAEQIREDRIDILVDLALHTGSNRLPVFARKPAPVQVTFAGYPGSTGLETIDYRLSDPYLDTPGMDESIYSERTLRLPHTFWCYDPLDCSDVPVGDLPAQTKGHVTFGCLNNFCKVNDPVLGLWSKVLHAVPSSSLLLMAPEGSARERVLEFFNREGIDSGRIGFVGKQPRRDYLALYHRIDISLDTLPYNGHTTSLDSLWMGVPVLTLVGQTIVGRAGLSQLMNLGHPEWVATSPEEYVKIAVELANDLPRLMELRATLRETMQASPLMDAAGFARDIEAAYRDMWRKWCAEPESQPCPK